MGVERGKGTTMNQKEQWQVSGSEAELYERYKVPRMFRPSAELLLDQVPPRPDQRVLDVACGTGIVARLAAMRVGPAGRVFGLDLNAGMIAMARANTPAGTHVEWKQGDAQALPFGDGSFDRLYCQQGLQFFPDKVRALQEFRRVLAPGGVAALSVWSPVDTGSPYNAALAAGLEKYADAKAARLSLVPFTLSDPAVLNKLTCDAGFTGIEIKTVTFIRHVEPTQEWLLQDTAGLPYSTAVSSLSAVELAAMVRELASTLKSYWNGSTFAVPMETHVVIARK